jgi:hypothetical protein
LGDKSKGEKDTYTATYDATNKIAIFRPEKGSGSSGSSGDSAGLSYSD